MLSFLRRLGHLPLISLILLLSPFLPVPMDSIRWHGIQTISVECGAVVLLVALLWRPWSLSALQAILLRQRQLPLLCLSLLLFWALLSCVRSPTPFAIQGFLLLAVGVFVANVVAAQADTPDRILVTVCSLLLTATLIALSGLAQLGDGQFSLAVGVLHDHQLFGAIMMLMIPLGLAVSLAPGTAAQRLCGQAALLVCLAGLLEAQHRSAWIGTGVSSCVFAALSFFRGRTAARRTAAGEQRRRLVVTAVPAAVFVIALLGMVWLSPDRERLVARLQTIGGAAQNRDHSMQWRQAVWQGTREMIARKPLLGWGVGSFPLYHNPYTHSGHTQEVAADQGPSIEDEAHNSYLQLSAELGMVGLLLWLGAFASLLIGGVRAVRHHPQNGLEQWILIGGVSAIAGQMTDALANPAWQFGHIALPLWIIAGLTAALSTPGTATAAKPPLPPAAWPWRIAQATAAVLIGFWLLKMIFQTAFALPAPHL